MTSTDGKRKPLEQEEFTPQKSNFKGDYAFTESGMLICHVLVYNMKPLMQQVELLEYCSGFGVVKKCDVIAAQGHQSDVGFFLFVDPKSAAEMLKCPTHCHHNKTFSVGAACDRLQPDFNYSSDIRIFDLNEDCLLMIFDYLSIEEQLQCARASQYFRDIFKTKFRLKNKFFESYRFWCLARRDIQDIFTIAGDCITGASIHLPRYDNEFSINLFTQFCPHLQSVKLSEGLAVEFFKKLHPSAADKITEINFDDEDLKDDFIRNLPLRNLEGFSIFGNSNITGAYLKNFYKLKKLGLCMCKNLKQDDFVNAIKNMKDLRSIDITYCIKLKNSLTEIIKYTPKLDSLYMDQRDSSLEHVHELLYLKELGIHMDIPYHLFDYSSAAGTLKYLKDNAEYIGKLKNLENLRIFPCGRICGQNYKFSNIEGLLQIIKSCTKLRSLDVVFMQFTVQGYKDIFDLLKSMTEKGERNHALTLISSTHQIDPIERKIIEKYQHPSILKFRISEYFEI